MKKAFDEYELLEAIDGADNEFVAAAENTGSIPARRRRRNLLPAALAAALAAALILPFVIKGAGGDRPSGQEAALPSDKPSANQTESAEPTDEQSVIRAFFVCNGNTYYDYAYLGDAKELVGKQLGRIKQESGRVSPSACADMEGTSSGTVCEANGFDPEFALVFFGYSYEICLYINESGLEDIRLGGEFLENRLHASEGLTGLSYESGASFVHSYGKRFELAPQHMNAAREFIAALDDAAVGRLSEQQNERPDLSGDGAWALTVYKGSVPIRIFAWEIGYAEIPGLNGMYLMGDAERMRPLFEILKAEGEKQEVKNTEPYRGLEYAEVLADEAFGAYFTREAPEGFEFIMGSGVYNVDQRTGDTLGTESVTAIFARVNDESATLRIAACSAEAFIEGREGFDNAPADHVPIDELDPSVPKYIDEDRTVLEVTAYDEQTAVTLVTNAMSAEEAVNFLRGLFTGK